MSSDAPLPSLHNSLGALFVADIFGALLLGILAVQTWLYYNEYPTDPWATKLLVGFTCFANALHQAFLCMPLYDMTITHYGDPRYLALFHRGYVGQVYTTSFIAVTIQCYYAYRIFILAGRKWFAAIPICVLSAAQFVVNMVVSAKSQAAVVDPTAIAPLVPIIKASGALATIVDVGIVIAMVWLLRLHKNASMFPRTHNLLNKLMLYSTTTGMLTALAAITIPILTTTNPESLYSVMGTYLIPRLYGVSFLAILLSRRGKSREGATQNGSSYAHSVGTDIPLSTVRHTGASRPEKLEIQISQTTYKGDDGKSVDNDATLSSNEFKNDTS